MNDHTRGGRVLAPRAVPAHPAPSPTRPIAALRAADGTRGAHFAGRAGTARGATRPTSVSSFMNSSGWARRAPAQSGIGASGGPKRRTPSFSRLRMMRATVVKASSRAATISLGARVWAEGCARWIISDFDAPG